MSKFLTVISCVVALFGLSSCKTTVQDGSTSVIIQDQSHPQHPHSDGGFCPPGQAKKGNC